RARSLRWISPPSTGWPPGRDGAKSRPVKIECTRTASVECPLRRPDPGVGWFMAYAVRYTEPVVFVAYTLRIGPYIPVEASIRKRGCGLSGKDPLARHRSLAAHRTCGHRKRPPNAFPYQMEVLRCTFR